MIILAILFLLTALLYASVGFGGGSTYNALLALGGADFRILPAIALVCNIIVVIGGVWRFGAGGHIRLGRIAPWIAASMPFAWLGGRLPISELVFVGLLGAALALAGLRLFFEDEETSNGSVPSQPMSLVLPVGAGLGFLAGIVGIGGGIFLAPVLHLLRWDNSRAIAGACSLFILVNSLSGLLGQAMKLGQMHLLADLSANWPLFAAVLIGGQIGSRLGTSHLPAHWLRRLTAGLVLYVAVRLLLRWAAMMAG
jgi:uncharacterized membrane protein YfcA